MNSEADIRRETPSLLVVENDPNVLWMIEKELEADFQLILRSSAQDAISLIEGSSQIDLILTDLDLGEPQDGLDVALKARARLPATRMVMMSAHPSFHPRVEVFLRLSETRYLKKPFTLEELWTSLRVNTK